MINKLLLSDNLEILKIVETESVYKNKTLKYALGRDNKVLHCKGMILCEKTKGV
jgi:hypothetical protein